MFSECSDPLWVDVAQNLVGELDWEPCYWTAAKNLEVIVKGSFPNIVFHRTLDAIRGIPPDECADLNPIALDQRILLDFSGHESAALKMMDRMDPGGSFTYQERIRLYHRQLGYWLAVLENYKPDLIVFPLAPHVVYDYLLYALANYLNLETVMFERTSIPGFIFSLRRFEDGSQDLRRRYQEKLLNNHSQKQVALPPDLEGHLQMLAGDYQDAVPFFTERYFENSRYKQASTLRKLISLGKYPHYFASVARNIKRNLGDEPPPNYLKAPGRNIEQATLTRSEWRRHKQDDRKKKARLNTYYAQLTEEPDLDRPYVYVALSSQPERTTSPLGGAFTHLQIMVKLLSANIPKDWYLYVKEFPFQLGEHVHRPLSRSSTFYDDLIAMPNVRLVPLAFPPFKLIDHAKAVATASGNTGWEAINRGTPALVFGFPWYRDCEGVFPTQTQATCAEALLKITSGYQVDLNNVRLYAQALEEVCINAYVEPAFQQSAGLSAGENVQALTGELKRFWRTINTTQKAGHP